MEKDNDIEFALTMFKSQLQDSLTLIGKAILKDLKHTLLHTDESNHLDIIKEMMNNPFEDIKSMCDELGKEYLEFKSSPEVLKMLDRVTGHISNNPNLLDDLVNATPEEAAEILKSLRDTEDNDGNLQ
jgi:hypothetical protein